MKFFSNDLVKLGVLIEQNKIKSILFYGPNQGYISTAVEHITKKINGTVSSYSSKDLTAENLSLKANCRNFFGTREIIKISRVGGTINAQLKSFFDFYDGENVICLTSEESLPTNSSLRKFFESSSSCAVIACYYDDEQAIAQIILQQCKKRNKNIDQEALSYLKTHLRGDHQIIKSELIKLFYYTHDQEIITIQDVLSSLSNDLIASGDDMCLFFAQKNYYKFVQEIQKLKQQNINEVLMIRALIRYCINILYISLKMEEGGSLENSLKALFPGMFYKQANGLKQIAGIYNSVEALRIIALLQNAEIEYKKNATSFDLFSLLIN